MKLIKLFGALAAVAAVIGGAFYLIEKFLIKKNKEPIDVIEIDCNDDENEQSEEDEVSDDEQVSENEQANEQTTE